MSTEEQPQVNVIEQMQRLKTAREKLADKKDALKKKKDAFAASIKAEEEEIKELAKVEDQVRFTLEPLAIAHYKETKDKSFEAGIKVQETSEYSYSEKEALEFAKSKDLFLLLDKKKFEAAVKAKTIEPDFVKVITEYRATFPSKIELA